MPDDVNASADDQANAGTPPAASPPADNNGTSGNVAPDAGTSTGVDAEVARLQQVAAEAEAKANKAQMEANRLKNEQEEAARKALEEQNEFKTLYEQEKGAREKLQQEQAERDAQTEARKIRDEVIAGQPTAVQEAAKRLLAKNPLAFAWAPDSDESSARAQLKEQLDALAESIPGAKSEDGQTPIVNGNNPSTAANSPANKNTPRTRAELNAVRDDLQKKLEGQGL